MARADPVEAMAASPIIVHPPVCGIRHITSLHCGDGQLQKVRLQNPDKIEKT
jgi:hypothetical protein